jgi:lysophospholipase L1-like esterase
MKSYLALGDSYTIGEGVAAEENFPSQTVSILNKTDDRAKSRQVDFDNWTTKIIAATGWTTDELDAAIDLEKLTTTFDVVSLLIGVNNQYRGRSVINFKTEFNHLLQQAIQFANNNTKNVFVLSIPDWGVTPFASDRDIKKIAEEIDNYNSVCAATCNNYNVTFIDVTTAQRVDGNNKEFLAPDLLHPSSKEYAKWAGKLANAILKQLQ